MTENQVYWWLILDNVRKISCFITIVGTLIVGVATAVKYACMCSFASGGDEDYLRVSKSVTRFLRVTVPIFLVGVLLTCFLPNSKQFALIKILPKIANSDFAAQVPEDMQSMYSMAKDYMKEMLKPEKVSD